MYKVLIVEDESLIREGIARVIRTSCSSFSEVYEAKDGEEALNMVLAYNPDLIITDIQMPKMSGIEFIEQVKEEKPDVTVIIISGYDDFHYAQQGLKLGVNDYMLKPVESIQFVEKLHAIARKLDEMRLLHKNQEELRLIVKESLHLYRERFFRDLIEGEGDIQTMLQRAERLGLALNKRYYTVALIRFEGFVQAEGSLTDVMIYEMIHQMSSRCMVRELDLHMFPVKHMVIALLIGSSESTKEKCFGSINDFMTRLSATLRRNLPNGEFHIALGSISESLNHLSRSYQQAEEAMLHRLSLKSRNILNYEELGVPSLPDKRSFEHAEPLILNLKLMERVAAKHHAAEYMEEVTSAKGAHLHWVKLSILELVMSLLRVLEEAHIHIDTFLQNKQLNPYVNVYQLDTVPDLQLWLEQFVLQCITELEKGTRNKGATHIEKVKQYVESRLSDSQLSLKELAVSLFLSPNYLRQLFRHETGESFVEYVTRVRMEKAALYLRDPLLKIQDIAERVGFEEQRYFSSCFKKHYAMTPTEYREAIQYGLV